MIVAVTVCLLVLFTGYWIGSDSKRDEIKALKNELSSLKVTHSTLNTRYQELYRDMVHGIGIDGKKEEKSGKMDQNYWSAEDEFKKGDYGDSAK